MMMIMLSMLLITLIMFESILLLSKNLLKTSKRVKNPLKKGLRKRDLITTDYISKGEQTTNCCIDRNVKCFFSLVPHAR